VLNLLVILYISDTHYSFACFESDSSRKIVYDLILVANGRLRRCVCVTEQLCLVANGRLRRCVCVTEQLCLVANGRLRRCVCVTEQMCLVANGRLRRCVCVTEQMCLVANGRLRRCVCVTEQLCFKRMFLMSCTSVFGGLEVFACKWRYRRGAKYRVDIKI